MSYNSIDRNQVSFYLFPVNNNRTAWRPFGLPVLLVVPRRRTATGIEIEYSQVDNVYIYIENVSQFSYVVGEDHILTDGTQLRYPSKELYRETLTSYDLVQRILEFEDLTYVDPQGNIIPYEDAQLGDFIRYTTSSKVTDTIPYYPDADYYDLSDILIDVELLPSGNYNLVYSADFYYRNVDSTDISFICVSQQDPISATFRFGIDHPGQVMNEMYRHTPPPYLTAAKKSEDTTVAFYRPFSDIINDIFDEQKLLESINWVNETPTEIIPYLAYLLGWDLPYFPQTKGTKSLDSLRRAIIRTTTYFQNLRGSERAIRELFNVFGIDAYIERLWFSKDGTRLIRPNEKLPAAYKSDYISSSSADQIDLIINRYIAETAPNRIIDPVSNNLIAAPLIVKTNLLFTPSAITQINNTDIAAPTNDITLEAYTVLQNTDADNYLSGIAEEIAANPGGFGTNSLRPSINGYLYSDKINGLAYDGVISHCFAHIFGRLGEVELINPTPDANQAPLSVNITYDSFTNLLSLSYNGYIMPGQAVYIFGYYRKVVTTVPAQLQYSNSNYFNLIMVTQYGQEQVDPRTLLFALNFLNKIKAFHSIVNIYRTSAELTETYEVTDLSIGGDTAQRSGTGIGSLQVPPAIIPLAVCGDPISIGYKPEDIALRLKKLESLTEEQFIQYSLNTYNSPTGIIPRDDTDFGGRISPNKKDNTNQAGFYAQYGQTVIAIGREEETDQVYHPNANANSQNYGVQNNPLSTEHDIINSDINVKSTNRDSRSFGSFTKEKRKKPNTVPYPLDGYTDYAYKGRVEDEILYRNSFENYETVIIKTGPLSMGSGAYWTYPRITITTQPNYASGGAPSAGIEYYNTGVNRQYFDKRKLAYYERLVNSYKTTNSETLHYTNREYVYYSDQLKDQAYQKHSLAIEKPTLHIPGCRFPTMGRLENDYTNHSIEARPWDDYYAAICGPINTCNHPNKPLNYELTENNQLLVYDAEPYKAAGNGQLPDQVNLSDNQIISANLPYVSDDIIHSLYSSSEASPYVTLDLIDLVQANDDYSVDEAIFSTARECNTGLTDSIDGYKSVYGAYSTSATYCSDFNNIYVSFSDPITNNFMFKLCSGIKDSIGYRLDAGTTSVTCGTHSFDLISSNSYYLRDGKLDFSPDIVNMDRKVALDERMNIGYLHCDGRLNNMMELV